MVFGAAVATADKTPGAARARPAPVAAGEGPLALALRATLKGG